LPRAHITAGFHQVGTLRAKLLILKNINLVRLANQLHLIRIPDSGGVLIHLRLNLVK
jgi:hypothetical protein